MISEISSTNTLEKTINNSYNNQEKSLMQLAVSYREKDMQILVKNFRFSLEEAEHIIQNTYQCEIEAIRAGQYIENNNFIGWHRTILRNKAKTIYKRVKKTDKRNLDISEILNSIPSQDKSDNPSLEKLEQYEIEFRSSGYKPFLKRVLSDRLFFFIYRIPKSFRYPVILRDIFGLNYKTISQILNQSEGTVKSQISRGRKMLKEKLGINSRFEYYSEN